MTNHFLLASDWLEKWDKHTKHIVMLVILNIIADKFMFYINVREYRCNRFQFSSQIDMSRVCLKQLVFFLSQLNVSHGSPNARSINPCLIIILSLYNNDIWLCYTNLSQPFIPWTTCNKQNESISHFNSSSGLNNDKQEISHPQVS